MLVREQLANWCIRLAMMLCRDGWVYDSLAKVLDRSTKLIEWERQNDR